MFHRSVIAFLLAIFSQLSSVTATHCLDDFLRTKFNDFSITLDSQMETFRSTKPNFFVQGKLQLRDLSVTHISDPVEVNQVYSLLNDERPKVYLGFTYTTKVIVSGKHTTSGTVLATNPYSGQGNFNATIEVTRSLESSVYIQPTLSKYLELQEIVLHNYSRISKYISTIYLENISNNAVFNGHQEYLDSFLAEIGVIIREKIHQQVQSRFEAFWQEHIPETNLVDICITS